MAECKLQRFKPFLISVFHLINFIVRAFTLQWFKQNGQNVVLLSSLSICLFFEIYMIIYLVLGFHLDCIVNCVKCKMMMKGSYCITKCFTVLKPWAIWKCVYTDKLAASSTSVVSFVSSNGLRRPGASQL